MVRSIDDPSRGGDLLLVLRRSLALAEVRSSYLGFDQAEDAIESAWELAEVVILRYDLLCLASGSPPCQVDDWS